MKRKQLCLKRLKQRRPSGRTASQLQLGIRSRSGSAVPVQAGRPVGRRWPADGRRTALRRSRRTGKVLPPQEGLQVLHREDRRDSLSRRPAAARVCGRARQDCAPASDGRLHHAPAPPDPRHQAGPEHRPAALCHAALITSAASRQEGKRKSPSARRAHFASEGQSFGCRSEPAAARPGSCPQGWNATLAERTQEN